MKSDFTGVYPNADGTSYQAAIKTGKRRYYAGSWPTAREAAIARDRVLLHLGATADRLSLPGESRALGPAPPHELQRAAHLRSKRARGETSRYLGVTFAPSEENWRAEVIAKGVKYRVAGYPTEREAAIARDRLALHAQGSQAELNFPELESSPASPQKLRLELGRAPEWQRRSRYLGVAAGQRGAWTAHIAVHGQHYGVSGYHTQRAAAEARDRMALYLHGGQARLNFPQLELQPVSPKALRTAQRAAYKNRTASRYAGVILIQGRQLAWRGVLMVGKRQYFLGYCEMERTAAIAVDRARLFYAGGSETAETRLNFPRLAHRLVPADAATLRAEARAAFKAQTTSRFRGVYRSNITGRWIAEITVNRKKTVLGRFDDEVEAALAYDRAAERLLGDRAKLNFKPTRGQQQSNNARGRRGRKFP